MDFEEMIENVEIRQITILYLWFMTMPTKIKHTSHLLYIYKYYKIVWIFVYSKVSYNYCAFYGFNYTCYLLFALFKMNY